MCLLLWVKQFLINYSSGVPGARPLQGGSGGFPHLFFSQFSWIVTFNKLSGKMRILYTIMAYGPQIIASEVHSELGREFRAADHQFSVLSLEDYGAGGEAGASLFAGEAGVVPLYKIGFGAGRGRRFFRKFVGRIFQYAFFLELVWGLVRFLRTHRHDFDLIHIEAAYPLGAAFALASRLSGIHLPFVVNLQGADVMSLPRYDYGYGRYRLARWLLRLTFKDCAGVRANSEQTAELARQLGAAPDKIKVIYRNISDDIFTNASATPTLYKREQQQLLRERYNLLPGPILLSYSRLHPFKGIDFLLEALPPLLKRWPDLNLLICGPSRRTPQFGDYRQYLEKIVAKLGIEKNVVFTGKVDFAQSASYLAGSDLLVVPSVIDALNKVVIEAAAVGTPSVMTNTTGIAVAAVRDGVGLSVAPTNSQALAEGLTELLGNPVRCEDMGWRGPIWAKSFSSAAIARQLLGFYRVRLTAVSGRLGYVAYPSSLTLQSANAIQTFSTCRELKQLAPDTLVLLPKLLGRPSRFKEIGATHLWRWPFNFFNNFGPLKVIPWSYFERTFFSFEVGLYLLALRLWGRGVRTIYVRDVICAYWLIHLWRPLLGVKVIYEVHDLEARNPSRAKNDSLRRWLEKVDQTVVGQSDKLVSLTGVFLDYVADQGIRHPSEHSDTSTTKVIPDAYDDKVYRSLSETERQAARQQLGLASDEFVIVYSGLTFAYRQLDKLVTAFAEFTAEHPETKARLLFLGGRPFERAALTEQAASLKLGERVQCLGPQKPPTINLYLNAASLLAIPDTVTDLTASPLKLFEYAAVGRPVMLPDLPALKEILSEHEAVYFERGQVAGMKGAIEWVYSHPAEARTKAEAACAEVAQHTYTNRAKSILEFGL